jgi:hypothetical protein
MVMMNFELGHGRYIFVIPIELILEKFASKAQINHHLPRISTLIIYRSFDPQRDDGCASVNA